LRLRRERVPDVSQRRPRDRRGKNRIAQVVVDGSLQIVDEGRVVLREKFECLYRDAAEQDIQRNRQRGRAFRQRSGIAQQQQEIERIGGGQRIRTHLRRHRFRQLKADQIVGSIQLDIQRSTEQPKGQRKRGAFRNFGNGLLVDRRFDFVRRRFSFDRFSL